MTIINISDTQTRNSNPIIRCLFVYNAEIYFFDFVIKNVFIKIPFCNISPLIIKTAFIMHYVYSLCILYIFLFNFSSFYIFQEYISRFLLCHYIFDKVKILNARKNISTLAKISCE